MHLLYREAASVLEKATSYRQSVKSAALSGNVRNKKPVYALVCETIKMSKVINRLLESSGLLVKQINKKDTGLSPWAASVMLYELLFGQGVIKGGGTVKRALKAALPEMENELAIIRQEAGVSCNKELLQSEAIAAGDTWANVVIPRYVRVNLLATTVEQVIQEFENEGWQLISMHDFNKLLDEASASGEGPRTKFSQSVFCSDEQLHDLLVFPPGTDLHDHRLLTDIPSHIILQDKSSCLSAFALNPNPEWTVLDACAAPGNKTTHIASLMKYSSLKTGVDVSGRIIALDIDKHRLSILKKRAMNCNATMILSQNFDFLSVSPDELPRIDAILLDPSCSGSGMIARLDKRLQGGGGGGGSEYDIDESMDDATELDRLTALASFQLTALLHAMSFPNVQRIVYSTCSIHSVENEDVVAAALSKQTGFQLVNCLPMWPHRGIRMTSQKDDDDSNTHRYNRRQRGNTSGLTERQASFCVRALPDVDRTNGFFVVCFERSNVNDSSHLENCNNNSNIMKNKTNNVGNNNNSNKSTRNNSLSHSNQPTLTMNNVKKSRRGSRSNKSNTGLPPLPLLATRLTSSSGSKKKKKGKIGLMGRLPLLLSK